MSRFPVAGARRLLDFMVEEGLLSSEDAARVEQEEQAHGGGVLYNVLKLKLATTPKLFTFVEEKMGLLFSIPEDAPPDPSLLDLIPPNIAQFYKIVPMSLDNNTLTLGVSTVGSAQLLPAIEEITGFKVRVKITHPGALSRALERYYSARLDAGVFDSASGERVFVLKDDEKQIRPINPHMLGESATPADWLRTILAEAVIKRSRHVMFRASAEEIQVSFVREGKANIEFRIAPSLFHLIATFIDYLTGLGAFESHSPQEKRLKVKINERLIALQVSSVVIDSGRCVTFELYDDKSLENVFETLFDAPSGEFAFMRQLLTRDRGLVLMSATPTAHRKLVLYTMLGEALKSPRQIFSLEESTFYSLAGVHQMTMGTTPQKTFPRMLESVLRQRPEILAVDCIREATSMEHALLSSSRCLVLAAYSSANIISTLRWLADSGFKSAIRAGVIPALVQTTTVERLCKYCKREYMLSDQEVVRYGLDGYRRTTFFSNVGCQFCKGAGILHQEPLCAVLAVDETTAMLLDRKQAAQARKVERTAPVFPSLLQKGVDLAAAGKVDIKDVLAQCAFLI